MAGANDISLCLHAVAHDRVSGNSSAADLHQRTSVQDAQDRKDACCPGQADKSALQPQASRELASAKSEEWQKTRVPEHAVDDKPPSNSDANQATPRQPGRQAASAALSAVGEREQRKGAIIRSSKTSSCLRSRDFMGPIARRLRV